MADTPNAVTITLSFSADEYDLLQQAGKGHAPDDWMRGVLLDVALAAVQESDSDNEEPSEQDDEEDALEPPEVAQDDDSDALPPIALGVAADVLERLENLMHLSEENLAWVRTVYTEICAHTVFPSHRDEASFRDKAERQFLEKQREIHGWLRLKRAH